MLANRRSVLLLGWSDKHIKACERLAVNAIVAYWEGDCRFRIPLSSARPDAAFMVESLLAPDVVLAGLARHGIDGRQLAGIIGTTDARVGPAALMSEHLGIPGIAVDTALVCRDKGLMKQRIRDAGAAPTPNWRVIDDIQEANESSVAGLSYPMVIKPLADSSSESALRVDSRDRLAGVLAQLQRTSLTAFIAEEFSPGTEWHIDGVVTNGVVRFLSVGAYGANLIKVHDGAIVSSTILHPERDAWAFDLAWPTAQRVVTALGHHDGVFHLETFYTDGAADLTFGECAARLGGSGIPDSILLARGVDLAAAEVQIRTGRQPTVSGPVVDGYIGFVYLPIVDGILRRAPSQADFAGQPGVVAASVVLPTGFRMTGRGVNINIHAARAIVEGDSRVQVEQRIADLVRWFTDALVVSAPDTAPAADTRDLWRAEVAVRASASD